MKTIRAYGCTRKAGNHKGRGLRTAVCIVLDAAHAQHTIRVFRRDQRPGGVIRVLSAPEADRLLAQPTDTVDTESGTLSALG